MVSYDLRLSSSHDFIKQLNCVIFKYLENIDFVLKLLITLIYDWDDKLLIYS